ncbi:CoA-transferase family III protein [Candidatus Terasakiella magnetica]|uniref:CoA-transferase family III protein n=1 Tax=Candidatus Terasakiella magnetica TaxID=1867952 RepID=A0A1C3RLR4_9PROT|nr:CaiB/BaiF CoA-transferase family protein [Candidatus Terasakiella magnetica]SCA58196.1 CoA-transferase family III protein [Candidatus Terasakiella magnetica]
MAGVLSHIKVLDLSRVLAGPWASQNLGDMGAEVLKIERPDVGDDTRHWGPPFVGETAAYFMSCNRNKKSLAIDFTQIEGQEIIRELVKHCDVVIENFKVGGLKKYGLDYDSLKAVKDDIIYCSITGFGQTGPYAQRAGYDFLIQGMAGLMSVTGSPESGPMKAGVALADIMTGLYATIAVQGALIHRDQSGQGQYIDLALMDVQVATMANQALNYLASGTAPGLLGNAHPNIVPYQAFATYDGHLILSVGNDGQFKNFCKTAGLEDIATDERFATNEARVRNRETLIPLIEQAMKAHDLDWWIEKLEIAGVPCGPINTLDRVFADEQVKHRGLELSLEGETPSVANPINYSETPLQYDKAPPNLGQHSAETLQEMLKLSPDELKDLADKGVIGM